MEVEVELEEETVDDTRQELERLRDDDKKPVIGLPSDGDECALSHVIPEASSALVVSDSMHLLVDAVVSADTKRRCGFWGTGGIGKTTTSAWLCRLSRVRRYFNVIAWVALGQTPNLVAAPPNELEHPTELRAFPKSTLHLAASREPRGPSGR